LLVARIKLVCNKNSLSRRRLCRFHVLIDSGFGPYRTHSQQSKAAQSGSEINSPAPSLPILKSITPIKTTPIDLSPHYNSILQATNPPHPPLHPLITITPQRIPSLPQSLHHIPIPTFPNTPQVRVLSHSCPKIHIPNPKHLLALPLFLLRIQNRVRVAVQRVRQRLRPVWMRARDETVAVNGWRGRAGCSRRFLRCDGCRIWM
jgi:hypothetical protein